MTYPGSVETGSAGERGDRQEEEAEDGDMVAAAAASGPGGSGERRDGPGLGPPASVRPLLSASLAFASSALLPSGSAPLSDSAPRPCALRNRSAANSRARAAACDWPGEVGEGQCWAESGAGSGEPCAEVEGPVGAGPGRDARFLYRI